MCTWVPRPWFTDCLSQPQCPTTCQQALPRSQENYVPDAGAACRLTHTGRLEMAVGWWQWHCRQITFSLYSGLKDTSAALAVKVACSPRGFSIAAEGAQVSVALACGSFVWVSTAQDKNRASKNESWETFITVFLLLCKCACFGTHCICIFEVPVVDTV